MNRKRRTLSQKIREQADTIESGLNTVEGDLDNLRFTKDHHPLDMLADAQGIQNDLETLVRQAQDLVFLCRENVERFRKKASRRLDPVR